MRARFRLTLLAVAGILLLPAISRAQQVGPPYFPQTLPSNTLVGRIQAGVGPASALTFSQLAPLLGLSQTISVGSTPVAGGSSGQCLTISSGFVSSSSCSGGGGGTPGGSNTQLQYNNAGSFGGVSGATSNGTILTVQSGDFMLAGSTSGSTQLNANSTASGTLTLPAATDTLVARATTDTLTNKTYDTAGTGNIFKINGTQITAISGNTAKVGTTSGTLTSGDCAKFDASGNIIDNGTTCAGAAAVSSVSNSDGTLTISPTTGNVVASIALGHANTWTAAQTFDNSDIKLLGSSTGATTFSSNNSGASNFTLSFPAATDTVAVLGTAQTWTAAQSYNSGDLVLKGSSSGTLTVQPVAAAGNNTLTLPGATDTVVARATTDTLTNKTITSSTDTLGGVTAAFGSDAKGDTYYNAGSSNVIGNLAIGTTGQCLVVASGLPSWGSCGGGGTPGGANTDVQFNNSSAFGGDSGFTYAGSGQVTIALGTITSNEKALNITGTFNASAVTFDAPIFENITNTASHSGSLLMDLQVGGTTVFNVDAAGSMTFAGSAFTGTNGFVQFTMAGFGYLFDNNGAFKPNSATALGTHGNQWTTVISNNFYADKSTSATKIWAYNTTDDAVSPTNYERGIFDWTTTSNTLTIGTQKGGTGTARTMILAPAQLYSAAGVALPSCAAGTKGYQAVVSDATGPTYNATYSSGGAVVAAVVCNGTNWVTQ